MAHSNTNGHFSENRGRYGINSVWMESIKYLVFLRILAKSSSSTDNNDCAVKFHFADDNVICFCFYTKKSELANGI